MASASQVSPTDTALASTMNEAAITLRTYFVDAGFTPSPSQWWHFISPSAQESTAACPSKGDYYTEQLYSTIPN